MRTLLQEKVEAKLGVEQADASCFFSDIVGFTTISEQTDPNCLIRTLAEYFNAVAGLVESRKGLIGDYIGDAVFAFWGVPEHVTEHAYLACESALAQQKCLESLRVSWKERGMPEFRIRIGIHSGFVLAGNVGSDTRMKYTLIGDTVNLASRLEGIGKQYGVEIVISKSTYSQPGVSEAFCTRVLDVVKVVGKETPTTILALISKRSEATKDELLLERLSGEMMELYLGREFGKCLTALHEMNVVIGDHISVTNMICRVQKLSKMKLDNGWNGAEELSSK